MLRYVTSTLTACALAGTVSVFAQQAPPAQDEKQPAPKETLTGCVIEAKTTDGGKAYVLNNVAGGSATMCTYSPDPHSPTSQPTLVRKWK